MGDLNPYLTRGSLDPPKSASIRQLDRFSRFMYSSRQTVATLYNGPFPKIAPSLGESGPHVIHCSLGTPDSTTQTSSRSVQPFLQGSGQSVRILYNGPPIPPKIAPSHGGPGPLSNTFFIGATQILNPNDISIGSPIFTGLTAVTDRQTRPTDRQTTLLGL